MELVLVFLFPDAIMDVYSILHHQYRLVIWKCCILYLGLHERKNGMKPDLNLSNPERLNQAIIDIIKIEGSTCVPRLNYHMSLIPSSTISARVKCLYEAGVITRNKDRYELIGGW